MLKNNEKWERNFFSSNIKLFKVSLQEKYLTSHAKT